MTLFEQGKMVDRLYGPIFVMGAAGFVGSHLLKTILAHRNDVYGIVRFDNNWRLAGVPRDNLDQFRSRIVPATVFDCIAYGGYPWETGVEETYFTNVAMKASWIEQWLAKESAPKTYIHAGSSSEYGDACDYPDEDTAGRPNSHYSVSKIAMAALVHYLGHKRGLRCCNLRLYSIYGPMEDPARLVPQLIIQGAKGGYPPLVDSKISRDFVYIDDAVEAFLCAAVNLKPADHGQSFNIGTGRGYTIRDAVGVSRTVFGLGMPTFGEMPKRQWDPERPWVAYTKTAWERLGWSYRTGFEQGFSRTLEWYRALSEADCAAYEAASKQNVCIQT